MKPAYVIPPIVQMRLVALALRQKLVEWEMPFTVRRNENYHHVFQINRFHLWAYWRPMTVSRYDQMTTHYTGPYLPIFASRNDYKEDEQYVYEGFDFNMLRNHHYVSRPWYFIIPDFLLQRPWPHERAWRWSPAVKVTPSILREILTLERDYGGWRRNSRGHLMIPKKTGISGRNTVIEKGQGWAKFDFECVSLNQEQQQELFDEGQDQY